MGAALTQQMKKTGKIVLCFFGDGAANEGSFHEALNLASIWKLPVIFYCENNLYGMSMSVNKHMNIKYIADRAASYGMPGYVVDGNDAASLYDKMLEITKYVREGNGPVLVESKTYRWLGHSKSDANVYRTKEEIEEWKAKDPIEKFKNYLIKKKYFNEAELTEIEEKAKEDIEKAVEFSNNSLDPELETALTDVYAD